MGFSVLPTVWTSVPQSHGADGTVSLPGPGFDWRNQEAALIRVHLLHFMVDRRTCETSRVLSQGESAITGTTG